MIVCGKSSNKILGDVSLTSSLIKAYVLVSQSCSFKPFSLTNLVKLISAMFVLSASADPRADLPAHLGPMIPKTWGSMAYLVIA